MRCNVFGKGDRTDRSIEHFMTAVHPDCKTFTVTKNGLYWDVIAKYEPVSVEPEKAEVEAKPEEVEDKEDGDKQISGAGRKQGGAKRSSSKRKVRSGK